jgi:Glycine-zipper domain
MVLPGTTKSFEAFQVDDALCRRWAARQCGVAPEQAAADETTSGAVVGTLVGAATGAAIGAATGSPATGAAVGAGVGLLGGTAAGAQRAEGTRWAVQRRYDMAYMQCMYAKGNQIPLAGRRQAPSYPGQSEALPPVTRRQPGVPPPPPGSPPPPPPGPVR